MLPLILTLFLLGAPAATPAAMADLTAKIDAVLETPEAAMIGELERIIAEFEARPQDVIADTALADELLRARVVLAWAQQDPEQATAAMDEAIRTAAGRALPITGLGTELKAMAKQRAEALERGGTAAIEVECLVPCQVIVNERRSVNPTDPLLLGTYRVWVVANKGEIEPLGEKVVLDAAGETARLEFGRMEAPVDAPAPSVEAPQGKRKRVARQQPAKETDEPKQAAAGYTAPAMTPRRQDKRGKVLVIAGGTLLGLSGVGIGTLIAGSVLISRAESDFKNATTGEQRNAANDAGADAEGMVLAGGITASVMVAAGVALLVTGKIGNKRVSLLPTASPHNWGLSIRGTF